MTLPKQASKKTNKQINNGGRGGGAYEMVLPLSHGCAAMSDKVARLAGSAIKILFNKSAIKSNDSVNTSC